MLPWLVDIGSGRPIVVLPGIQGRWEWIRPAVDALAARHRVLTFSLCGDARSGAQVDAAAGLDNYVRQVDRALDDRGLASAIICGVSYGGRAAIRYAASRPRRTAGLILVATPGPSWSPDARVRGYVHRPLSSAPAFLIRSPGRLWPEIRAAHASLVGALACSLAHVVRVTCAPMRPRLMAQRIGFLNGDDLARDARRITAPTLVVTGEPHLDRVVDVEGSRELARVIPGARLATLERTGHIGLITRPQEFARLVQEFVGTLTNRTDEKHECTKTQRDSKKI